jgi:ankyrin repeat protein
MIRSGRKLIRAARENNLPEVRRLLSVGANVNAKDNGDWAPLHWASGMGHVQVVKVLREHGADTEARTVAGSTSLHNACAFHHLAVVNELLSPGAEIDANNDTNVATSSILGKRKRRGSDTEAKDNDGNTPLHIASEENVKALLSNGADIFAANNEGELPVDRAIEQVESAVAKYLLQHFYATIRHLPLHVLLENLTWIRDANSRVRVPPPPLHIAFKQDVLGTDDVVEILEYLVGQNHELISSVDQDGSLPLHVACRRGASFAIIQSLANLFKASVKSVTCQGDLPLFLACEMPETSLDTIFLLMKLSPDLVYR